MSFVRVLSTSDLEVGTAKMVSVDGNRILVVKDRDGAVWATSALCTHARVYLVLPELTDDGLIECPAHGAMYCPRDGSVRQGPALTPLTTYKTAISNDDVLVDLAVPVEAKG